MTDRRSPRARRPIPAHWAEHMDRRGIPSIRQLAQRAGMSQPPIEGVIYGDSKNPSERTLGAIAEALDIPLTDVYWLAGKTVPLAEIWEPPAEANRLTPKQRDALDALIRAIVDPGERAAAPSNVHQLHPERDHLDVAAHKGHGRSEGQQMWGAGEEDQDE